MIQNPIIAGKKLPELTNPAGPENIKSGYEAIDGSGNKITGTNTDTDLVINSIKVNNNNGSSDLMFQYTIDGATGKETVAAGTTTDIPVTGTKYSHISQVVLSGCSKVYLGVLNDVYMFLCY